MSLPAREPLPDGEAHIWYVWPDSIVDVALLARYQALLGPEELARHRRLRIDKVRHEHLVTRALARTCLARYLDVAPESLTFRLNEWGRPEIDAPEAGRWLRFNLSNTYGLIACIVARDLEVGVDVEAVDRRTEPLEIADRFFSETEVRALHAQVGADAQRERFFQYWTLKEAYIKARGMGLALPLGQFSFHLDEPGPVRITFGPEIDDDPTSWQFWRASPSNRHRMAAALRRGSRSDLRVELRPTTPLSPIGGSGR